MDAITSDSGQLVEGRCSCSENKRGRRRCANECQQCVPVSTHMIAYCDISVSVCARACVREREERELCPIRLPARSRSMKVSSSSSSSILSAMPSRPCVFTAEEAATNRPISYNSYVYSNKTPEAHQHVDPSPKPCRRLSPLTCSSGNAFAAVSSSCMWRLQQCQRG